MITHRRHARYEPDHRKNPRCMKIPIKQLARGRARQEGELVAPAGGAQAPRCLGAGSDRSGRAGGPTLWFSTSTIPTWPGAATTSGSTNMFSSPDEGL